MLSGFPTVSESRTVAVVIPSWNTLRFLPACIASLGDEGLEVETMVVDNGSEDGSVGYLEKSEVPHVALGENVGFAAAVNLGVERTSAPAVMVLNADAVLEPGALPTLLAALQSDERLGGVQPRILQMEEPTGGRRAAGVGRPAGEAPIYSAGQALTSDGRALEEGAGEAQRAAHRAGREIFGVCGAACLLRRELFEQVGGYDEAYFAFYEDVDLNVRARIAGWRFGYVPEAVAWHVGNAAWQKGFARPAARNAQLVGRNRLATQAKFMPAGALPRIAVVEAGALLRAARRRRFLATLRGKLAAVAWLPRLLRERRRLSREGDLGRAQRWLGVRLEA